MTSKEKPATPWLKQPEKSDQPVEFTQEAQAVPYSKEEVEDEVLEAVEEAKEEECDEPECCKGTSPELHEVVQPKVAKKKTDPRVLLTGLRKQDSVDNRTCARCFKRLPIDKFPRLKKSEVCEDCE